MENKKAYVLLFIILILGVFLRFYNIGAESFWLDEGQVAAALSHDFKVLMSDTLLKGNILPEYYVANSDLPVYYTLLFGWSKIFGINELFLRSLSALFDMISMILLFLLAREFIGNKGALISSFLYSISLTLISYSQEARPYSLHVLLAVLSAYMLARALNSNRNSYWLGFIAATSAGLYNHFLYLLFVAAEIAYILFKVKYYLARPKLFKKITISLFIIGVIFLPMAFRALNQNDPGWLGKPSMAMAAKFMLNLNTGFYPSAELINDIYKFNMGSLEFGEWILLSSVFSLVIIFSALLLCSFYLFFKKLSNAGKRKSAKQGNISLFIIWFSVPILLAIAYSLFTKDRTIFGPINYLLYCIPPYIVLVSNALSKMKHAKYTLAAILILSIAPISAYYANPDKQQWREAASFMRDNSDNGLILINIYTGQAAFKYYYGEAENVMGIRNEAEAIELAKDRDDVWIILASTKYSDPERKIKRYFDSKYKLAEEKHFFEVDAYHYRKLR